MKFFFYKCLMKNDLGYFVTAEHFRFGRTAEEQCGGKFVRFIYDDAIIIDSKSDEEREAWT